MVAHCQVDSADWKERAAAMWAAANQDDFDTARVAGNARTHGPHLPRKGRCGGLVASSGSRGSETTLRRCAGLVGQWVAHSQVESADRMERGGGLLDNLDNLKITQGARQRF